MSYGNKSIIKLEKEFCLYRGLLTDWRQKHEKWGNDNFKAEYFSRLRLEKGKIQELEKKIKHMDEKFLILKAAGRYLNKEAAVLLNFILKNEKEYSIRLMCNVLNINRSFYHKWKRNIPNKTQKLKALRQQKIKEAFFNSQQRYGALRIAAMLQNEGFVISLTTVKRYMKELGLQCNLKK
ncbi:IS3 family transposase [Flavobacterium anhuiense]|uniref:IS3 family transposase n=1 Tax=Flavobacterium anhuiense TaxID=459526 RepID=UPI003D984522